MAAVPHFDMKPGERLKALREVGVDASIAARHAPPAEEPAEAREIAALGSQPLETFSTRKSGWFGQVRGDRDPGGRRCQLRHPARRMSGSGRRKRLRQDHGEQAHHARAHARLRADHLQRRRRPGRRLARAQMARRCKKLRTRIQMVFQDPFSSLQPAHDGPEHPARAAGNPRPRRRGVAAQDGAGA